MRSNSHFTKFKRYIFKLKPRQTNSRGSHLVRVPLEYQTREIAKPIAPL